MTDDVAWAAWLSMARGCHVFAVHLNATNRLKPGQLESERKRVPGLVDFIETSEPRLIAFNEFVN